MKRPCFIISTGRSGSKMLACTLACHQDTLTSHEPKPYLSTENYLSWKGRISDAKLRRNIRDKRDWLIDAAKLNNLCAIESSHFLAHLISHLYQLYNPRFIYIYRDGRDFVRSGLVRSWYTTVGIKTYLARILRRITLQPFGDPIEDHQLPPPREAHTRFEKAAWLWNEVNRAIQTQLNALPQNDVFYLQLEAFDGEKLNQILDFIELKTSQQTLNQMISVAQSRPNRTKKPFSIPPKDEWTEERTATFMKFAGEQMRSLGYGSDE